MPMIKKTILKILILMMGALGMILAIDPVITFTETILTKEWMKLLVGLGLTGLTIFLSKEWGIKK